MSNFNENFILYVCFRDGEPSLSEIGRDVREQVRNEWGHCKVNDWNDLKYLNCFSLMIKFAKTFPDSMKSKVVLIEELTEWQENGLKLVGKYVEPELLRKVFKEYSFILKQIKKWQDVNLERFSTVSERIDRFSEKVIDLENNIGEVKTNFSDLHSDHLNLRTTIKSHEDRLKHIEESDAVIRKSPGNRPKVNLNNIKISKGMPICLLLLYFIVSLSRQRLFMAAGAGPS